MKILVIEARYYESISEDLLQGALAKLQAADAEVVKVNVPGALEIPHIISYAEKAKAGFDGYVALGRWMCQALRIKRSSKSSWIIVSGMRMNRAWSVLMSLISRIS